MIQIQGLMCMYFDAVVVEFKTYLLLFRFALAILCKEGGRILVEFSSSLMRIFCVTMALFFQCESAEVWFVWSDLLKQKMEDWRFKNTEIKKKGKYLSAQYARLWSHKDNWGKHWNSLPNMQQYLIVKNSIY